MEPGSLRLERSADEVRLTWVGDGPGYVVHRSDDAAMVNSPTSTVGTSIESEYVDAIAAIPCASCFYLVQPEPEFACGELTCSISREYCFVYHPGVPESPPQHACQAIPDECLQDPSCPCVQSAIADEWPEPSAECVQDDDDAITISVYGA